MTIGERNKQIICLYMLGIKYDKISERMRIEKSRVINVVHDYKKGRDVFSSNRISYVDKKGRNDEILMKAAEGMTRTAIAAEMGMSISAVSRIISKDKPEQVEEEPVITPVIVPNIGDNVLFQRNRELLTGKITALHRHTVTCIVDFGRYKMTCSPQYREIEAVV